MRFDVAGFTNLSPDHLDFHRDMDDYFDAKAQLFTAARSDRAVVCVDDEWGARVVGLAGAEGLPVTTYAVGDVAADWRRRRRGRGAGRVGAARARAGRRRRPARGAAARGVQRGQRARGAGAPRRRRASTRSTAADGIAACPGVPGRMERVPDPDLARGLLAFVDYAHTPDAVERAARGRDDRRPRPRRSWCSAPGGDRDPHKRAGDGGGRRARRPTW